MIRRYPEVQVERFAVHKFSAGRQWMFVLFMKGLKLIISEQIHWTYLHPRQVTLNRRMGHGDAEWKNNAGLRFPRSGLCLQSRLCCG